MTCRLVQQSIGSPSMFGPSMRLDARKSRANALHSASTSLRRNQYKSTGSQPAANFSIGSDSPWQDWLVLTLVLLGGVFISAVVPVRHDEDGNDHREGPEQSFVAAVLAAAGPPSACHGSKREAGNERLNLFGVCPRRLDSLDCFEIVLVPPHNRSGKKNKEEGRSNIGDESPLVNGSWARILPRIAQCELVPCRACRHTNAGCIDHSSAQFCAAG